MSKTKYKTYVADLKNRIDDLVANEADYQVFDLTFELSVSKVLMVGKMSRKKSQTDTLFYATDFKSGARSKVSDATAITAFYQFADLGQFLAIGDTPTGPATGEAFTMDGKFPMCAVEFRYRKKGQEKAQSTKMILIGFNDDADASDYAETMPYQHMLVDAPLLSTSKVWDWK